MTNLKQLAPVAIVALTTGIAVAGPQDKRMIDADGDGAISKQEMREKRMQMFTEMDANGDGFVTADERDAAHDRVEARHKSMKEQRKARRDKWVDMVDENGDGRISRSEMENAPMPMFDKADANNDGRLTHEEMRAAHQEGTQGMADDDMPRDQRN